MRWPNSYRLAIFWPLRQARGGHWRPGVGKTTLLDAILPMLAAKGIKILLGAPTGRAAKRMTDQTGTEAKTIHRLLEIDPKYGGFKRNAEHVRAQSRTTLEPTIPRFRAYLKSPGANSPAVRPPRDARERIAALRYPATAIDLT